MLVKSEVRTILKNLKIQEKALQIINFQCPNLTEMSIILMVLPLI